MIREGLGLNLFSIRNYLDTEEHFLEAAKKLKEMGYSYMQFSGAPFNAEMIKRVIDATGMKVVLTHVPMDRILNDTEALMDEHASIGCYNIGLGMMPIDAMKDEALCRETIEKLNDAGKRMAARGFKFFYHHHHFEFFKFGEKSVFDMLIDAPYINFTLDTYWIQYGGNDVVETIKKLKGRIECVHLKDYMIAVNAEGKGFEPRFAPVGDGNIDFARAIEAARESGAKYFLVVQDNAAVLPDTLGQVERSVRYVAENLI